MSLNADDIAALYEEESELLLRYLMRRTFDAQVAVDLLAETFAVAYETRERFRGESEPRTWVFAIANNLLAEFFRSGNAEKRAANRIGMTVPAVDDDELRRIEDLAETAGLRGAIAEGVRALPVDQREAIELRVVQERGYADVASVLGVSEQVARARVSRGLRKLKEIVESTHPEEVIEHA